jgi:hypothetical protein
MATRIEYLAREYLRFYLPNDEVIYNWRPDFLKNENTGKNLEVDIYYPFLRFGVEVNSLFHETRRNRSRDSLKIARCKVQGIRLIQVWNNRQLLRLRFRLAEFLNDKQFNLLLPNNDYQAIIQYQPRSSKAGYAVNLQIQSEKGIDAQNEEIVCLQNRRLARQ